MTKANIIDEIVNQTGIARKDVSATVEAFMDAIKSSLIDRKENVYLRGFGSFIVKHSEAETEERHVCCQQPSIGKEKAVPYRPSVVFLPVTLPCGTV